MTTTITAENAKSDKLKIVAALMRQSLDRRELAHAFGIEIRGKESVFDALIREKKCENFSDAVALVGKNFPPKNGGTWGELASWVYDYEKASA